MPQQRSERGVKVGGGKSENESEEVYQTCGGSTPMRHRSKKAGWLAVAAAIAMTYLTYAAVLWWSHFIF